MWSGGHQNPRNPPPYYLPPGNPPYGQYPTAPNPPHSHQLYPNPNPDGNISVLSHSGVPSPNSSAPQQNYGPAGQQNYGAPPAYGIHSPPAGAVNYQNPNPYQPQAMSGDDIWVQVNHGSSMPPGPVQAMDRQLNNNDNSAKNCFVALWNNNGEPVYGRAWYNNGRVEAWFPYGGQEHHSSSIGSFSVLSYAGPPRQNFRYAWVPINQLNSMCQPVRQQDYAPAVIPDLRIGSFNGELLGKANLAREMAWVSHGGKEHHFSHDKYRNSSILCRVPL